MSEPIISDRRADTRQAVIASAHRTLAPGERIIDGRVFYSAAWLSPEREVAAACDRPPPAQPRPDEGRHHA